MITSNTILKATFTILATCLLMACGGDDSSANDKVLEQTSFIYTSDRHTLTITLPAGGPTVGKSVFSINIKDANNLAVEGITPTMIPMMTMAAGHKHSAPHTGCSETDADGNADCTAYFLMASEMNNVAIGVWDLAFTLAKASEVIHFTPTVSAPIGDTALVKLKGGLNDQIPTMTMATTATDSMTMTESRSYFIFNNGISGMDDNRSVELFVAAKESMNNFPALTQNAVLNQDTEHQMTITTVQLQVSSDNRNWTQAIYQGKGIWQASGISDLTETLYISLTIDGEIKTTDGEVAGANNASAAFTLSSAVM